MPNAPELPPIATEPISVLLLARDDEPHVEEVLTGWTTQLSGLGRDYEILVADDGSTDRSADLVEAWAAREPQVRRLLRHETRRGSGAALRTGLAAARYPLLLTATCDRQFLPADLCKMLDEMNKVHLVAGYRVWQPVPWPLRWLGRLYRAVVRVLLANPLEPLPGWLGRQEYADHVWARMLFALRIKDVNCPFRVYRRSIFDRIPIQSDGTFAQAEVLAKANFLGCMMTEVPVAYQPRPTAEDRRQRRADLRRVLLHPDFGPAVPPAAAPCGSGPVPPPAERPPDGDLVTPP
jgi:glycosyltransferase involved in cell wall biosynthesis